MSDLEIPADEMDLTKKYRPRKLVEVVGQDHVKEAIAQAVQSRERQAFLFTGTSGAGKTTLARIVARMVKTHPQDIIEVNAASARGIDDMREVVDRMSRPGLRKQGVRFCILDEVHALTSDAKSVLLKALEDNPKHSWWALCTTEGDKVLEAVKNRCLRFDLKPVDQSKIIELLTTIDGLEKFGTSKAVLAAIAETARGSPRRALTSLSLCKGLSDVNTALERLSEPQEGDEKLAKALLDGTIDSSLAEALKLRNVNAESVRIRVSYYMAACVANPRSRARALKILSAFNTPFPQQSGYPSLLLAVAKAFN